MLRQIQLPQQLLPIFSAVGPAGQPQLHEILLCDAVPGWSLLALDGGSGFSQGLQNNFPGHALHSQLSFLARGGFPPFLARNIRDIGVFQESAVNGAFQVIADHKPRSIRIREHNESPGSGYLPKKLHLFFVLENTKAGGFQNGGIHDLAERVFVVAALHHDGLPNSNHSAPPVPAPAPAAPECAGYRRRRFS